MPESAPNAVVETSPGIFETPGTVYDDGAQPKPRAEVKTEDDPLKGLPAPTEIPASDEPSDEPASTEKQDDPVAFEPFVIEAEGLEDPIEVKSVEDIKKWKDAFDNTENGVRSLGTKFREFAEHKKQFQQYADFGTEVANLPDEYRQLIQYGLQGHPLQNALKVVSTLYPTIPEKIDDGYGNMVDNPEYLKWEIEQLKRGKNTPQQRPQKAVESGDPDNPSAPPAGTQEFGIYSANKVTLYEAIDDMAERYGNGKDDVKSREHAMARILKGMEARNLNGVNAAITSKQYVALALEADPKLKERAQKLDKLRKENKDRNKPKNNDGQRAAAAPQERTFASAVRV